MVWMIPRRMVIAGLALTTLSTLLLLSKLSVVSSTINFPLHSEPQVPPPVYNSPEISVGDWTYNAARDANNYGLDSAQCRAAFPKLFTELDKSVAQHVNSPITLASMNRRKAHDGQVRVMIHDAKMRILNYGAMNRTASRGRATLNAIHRAINNAPDRSAIPNLEFVFDTEDFTGDTENFTKAEYAKMSPIWTYTKREEDDRSWLMPDFGYWSWPEIAGVGAYEEIRERIQAIDAQTPFWKKDPRLIWRGNVNTAPFTRGSLVNNTVGKDWSAVHALEWSNPKDIKKNLIHMEDHCKYQFMAHTEGRSYSGRGKYLLNCRSILFTHPLMWLEAHHGAMKCATFLPDDDPEINCIQVEQDWSDLEEKMDFLLDHPDVSERIAERSKADFTDRYLTPAAEACHWRELFVGWRSVSFEPEYWIDKSAKKARGMPWESFVLLNPLHLET